MSDDAENGETASRSKGVLSWFARNSVAANIIMVIFLLGGYIKMRGIKQEVFPEFDLDIIVIAIPYPGASPSEVAQGVLLSTEEAVRGVDGVKEVRSTAGEGIGYLVVELMLGTDADQALNDVKASVDRITSFPENAERPQISIIKNRRQVVSLVVYGDVQDKALRAFAEQARTDLLTNEKITVVELAGVRPLEISIEVPQEKLVDLGLDLNQIAAIVKQASVDLPGGGVKTRRGEVLVRTTERRDRGPEFEDIVLLSNPGGAKVRVGDVATVKDGFAETDQVATFNGKPAIMVNVFRVGDQKPLEVSAAVHSYVDSTRNNLPPGVHMAVWFDSSEFYQARLDMLLRNAFFGLVLVLLVLGIFLAIRLAFWVTLGIPVSFIGAFLFLPSTDVSINMLSLFAFIVVLGMVVDDAIIVGEAVYKRRQEGVSRLRAAILGVKEVAVPVVFAVVTTVMAYMPLLFVPGIAGKFFRNIPIVVILVLLISLVESLIILPAHLAHSKPPSGRGMFGFVARQQQRFSRYLEHLIEKFYVPAVKAATHRRYLTLSICVAIFLGTAGFVVGGRLEFTFMPKVESDVIFAEARLPYGSSVVRTREVEKRMLAAAREVLEENGGEDRLSRGIFSQIGFGSMSGRAMSVAADPEAAGTHMAESAVYLVESSKRSISASKFAREWRERLEDIPGLESLLFKFETGPSAGAPIHIELSHPDMAILRRAAKRVGERLETYAGVYDIDNGFTRGKEQLDLTLKPAARSLGITEFDLARQVRAAFFGAEAVREQRGRDELRVYVRLPRDERESEYNIEELLIRPPSGGEIRLADAAWINRGRSRTSIQRIDGRQAVVVTANVDTAQGNAIKIMNRVRSEVLPRIKDEFPGIHFTFGGEEKERREINKSLAIGFLLALLGMFALLAIAFRSYVQPIIILFAIPFGFVGAVWGHVIMGYDLSLMSMMGVVALAGVVVNDSLILVVSANRYREAGMTAYDAAIAGGSRRFRPIILTSLTTFFGLAPMILETSVQARFLIPMAVSLGFGVMFGTMITLLLVPALFMIVDDAARGLSRLRGWLSSDRVRVRGGLSAAASEADAKSPHGQQT